MTFWSAVRYFHAATPVPIAFRVAMVAVVLLAAALAIQESGSDTALVSLLVVQMFAVSTGFRSHATRGRYDVVLIRRSRGTLCLAHWTAATAPGALAWATIAALEITRLGNLRVLALHPSSITAFFLVSLIAWAISAALGPLSGGSLWLITSVAVLIQGGAVKLVLMFSSGAPTAAPLRIAIGLAMPLFLVGRPSSAWELVTLMGIGAAFFGAASLYLARTSFPLREEAS